MNEIFNWFMLPVHNIHQASTITETVIAFAVLIFTYAIILFVALCICRAIFYMINCVGLKFQEGEAIIVKKNHFIGDETRLQEMADSGYSPPVLMEGSYCPDAWSVDVKVGNTMKTWKLNHDQFNQLQEGQIVKAQYRSGRIKKCVDLKKLVF